MNIGVALPSFERVGERQSVEYMICILQKCKKKKNVEYAKRVHMHIYDIGLEANRALGNYLVPMFVDCGSMPDAQQVFDRLSYRNEYSWTSLIQGYIQCGKFQHALNLYQNMQEDCVTPTRYTFVALLKACAWLKCIERGQEIHAEIAKKGYEQDPIVGSTLVHMYAKCGSLARALEVFNELSVKDIFSWTALIAGYTEHGLSEEALSCLERMQLEGVSPDDITLVCCLKACSSTGAIEKGRELHLDLAKQGFEREFYVANTLLDMYAKCGSLAEAQEILDKLSGRDVVSWTTLIKGYTEQGLGEEALKCLQGMHLEGVSLDAVTFVCSLKACGITRKLDRGQEIYSDIAKMGYEGDHCIGSTLLDLYATCSSLAEAQEVFDRLFIQDVVSWNALIAGYVEHGLSEEVLNCFQQMQLNGVVQDACTLAYILKACGSIGVIDLGLEIHAESAKHGFEKDPFIGNSLVDMYAKCFSLAEAGEVFDKLLVQDVISWNTIIAGYCERGLAKVVLNCLEQMHLEGISADIITLVYSLKACGCVGSTDWASEIHTEIAKQGFERDPFVGNTLVDMYAKCCFLAEAQELFDKVSLPDSISWNALIAGYSEHKLVEEVLDCLQQMPLQSMLSNAVTFVCGLKACANIGSIEGGREIHAEVFKWGYETYCIIGNTLVDMYVKCGLLGEAQEVFGKQSIKGVVPWNTLIAGYVGHGLYEEALNCLGWMKLECLSPDVVTFVCSLKACGGLKAIDMGLEIHEKLMHKGLERDSIVGRALVDLYAKCGFLIDAGELLDKLPVRDVFSWTALIAGYAEFGLGKDALNILEQMQLDGVSPDAVTFVCSLKACGSQGTVDRSREIHAEIVKLGFERDPLISNTLVDAYIKCGFSAEAWGLFNMLPVEDVVLWNMLITGFAESGLSEEALNCFQQMQLEGVSPNAVTLVCSLKASGSIRAIDSGREIQAETAKQGFERDPFVGNTLMDIYTKCGFLAEAEELFDKLPRKDVVSWNVLIAGYAEHGLGEEALICLEQMQCEGVSPDAVTFICSLKACSSFGATDRGQQIHSELLKRGYEIDCIVGSALVEMYAACASSAEAREVLDRLPNRDLVSWTALIAEYAECGHGEEALNCFQQMKLEAASLDPLTLFYSLKACGSIRTLIRGQELNVEVVKQGYKSDHFIWNMLVDMYARCGSLGEAQETFDKLVVQDVFSWTALISGYVEHGLDEEVLHCFEQMQVEGVSPDAVTFIGGLKVCGTLKATDIGQEIHSEIVKQKFDTNPLVGSALVNMYALCGLLAEAQEVCDRLPVKDAISWTALITGYAAHGTGEEGLMCFEQMQLEGASLDTVILVCMVKACGRLGAVDIARDIHAKIVRGGHETDSSIGSTFVDMYAKCGYLAEAWDVFDKLVVQDVVSWTALIAGYVENRLIEEASICFEQMQRERVCGDLVLWNALILGYADQGDNQKAFKFFVQMQEQGLSPNTVTFIGILKESGNSALLGRGKRIHAQVCRFGKLEAIEINLVTGLIDMYGKCGSMDEAQQVFDAMPRRALVIWNALVIGYAHQGESDIVFDLVEQMAKEGMRPDWITFLSVFIVCSHVGLVDKGQKCFEAMNKEYGITPTIKHHNCMVDLLGRAGRLDEAVEMLEKMPFEPDVVVWNTMLGACYKWGDVMLGRRAFQNSTRLDYSLASAYILMSNIYAVAHMEEDTKKIGAMRLTL